MGDAERPGLHSHAERGNEGFWDSYLIAAGVFVWRGMKRLFSPKGFSSFAEGVRLFRGMRVLGIDYGQARMGIALSDESGRIAMPLTVLEGTRDLKSRLGELVRAHGVERVVIGNPLDRDGNPGEMSRRVETVANRISEWFGIKCDLWDERYTTSQAAYAARKSGGSKQKGFNDMAAATLILQSYLDSMFRCS